MFKFCLVSLLLSILSLPVVAENVSLYNWEANLDKSVLASFTKETGHTVTQFYFDDEDARDAIISTGRAKQYDLMIIDNLTLQIFGQHGKFHDLSDLQLPNQKHIDKGVQKVCGRYGVPDLQFATIPAHASRTY